MMQEFVQQIKNLISSSLEGIHTVMPGTVVSFDASTGLASVQSVMKSYAMERAALSRQYYGLWLRKKPEAEEPE